MYNLPHHHARKLRQFRHLSTRIEALIRDRSWLALDPRRRQSLLEKLRRAFRQLRSCFPAAILGKALGGLAFLLGLSRLAPAQTPSFGPATVNPFGIAAVDNEATPALADIDGDGDLDLFVGDYYGKLNFFENTGGAISPAFAAPDTLPFGLGPFVHHVSPAFADIDNDGDLDLFAGQYDSGTGFIEYFANIGSAMSPAFDTAVTNPWGITGTTDYSYPTLADIDGDGDQDLFVGEYYGNLVYFENTGTASAPAFAVAQTNPFGISPVQSTAIPAFADPDGDGDPDLLVGEYEGNLVYFENTGSSSSPAFGTPVKNPFGLTPVIADSERVSPAFADLDGDGDPDLLVGDYYGNTVYFENTSLVSAEPEWEQELVRVFPSFGTGWVTVDPGSHAGTVQVQVFDAEGRLRQRAELRGDRTEQLFLSGPAGVYILRLENGEGAVQREKVIKY